MLPRSRLRGLYIKVRYVSWISCIDPQDQDWITRTILLNQKWLSTLCPAEGFLIWINQLGLVDSIQSQVHPLEKKIDCQKWINRDSLRILDQGLRAAFDRKDTASNTKWIRNQSELQESNLDLDSEHKESRLKSSSNCPVPLPRLLPDSHQTKILLQEKNENKDQEPEPEPEKDKDKIVPKSKLKPQSISKLSLMQSQIGFNLDSTSSSQCYEESIPKSVSSLSLARYCLGVATRKLHQNESNPVKEKSLSESKLNLENKKGVVNPPQDYQPQSRSRKADLGLERKGDQPIAIEVECIYEGIGIYGRDRIDLPEGGILLDAYEIQKDVLSDLERSMIEDLRDQVFLYGTRAYEIYGAIPKKRRQTLYDRELIASGILPKERRCVPERLIYSRKMLSRPVITRGVFHLLCWIAQVISFEPTIHLIQDRPTTYIWIGSSRVGKSVLVRHLLEPQYITYHSGSINWNLYDQESKKSMLTIIDDPNLMDESILYGIKQILNSSDEGSVRRCYGFSNIVENPVLIMLNPDGYNTLRQEIVLKGMETWMSQNCFVYPFENTWGDSDRIHYDDEMTYVKDSSQQEEYVFVQDHLVQKIDTELEVNPQESKEKLDFDLKSQRDPHESLSISSKSQSNSIPLSFPTFVQPQYSARVVGMGSGLSNQKEPSSLSGGERMNDIDSIQNQEREMKPKRYRSIVETIPLTEQSIQIPEDEYNRGIKELIKQIQERIESKQKSQQGVEKDPEPSLALRKPLSLDPKTVQVLWKETLGFRYPESLEEEEEDEREESFDQNEESQENPEEREEKKINLSRTQLEMQSTPKSKHDKDQSQNQDDQVIFVGDRLDDSDSEDYVEEVEFDPNEEQEEKRKEKGVQEFSEESEIYPNDYEDEEDTTDLDHDQSLEQRLPKRHCFRPRSHIRHRRRRKSFESELEEESDWDSDLDTGSEDFELESQEDWEEG